MNCSPYRYLIFILLTAISSACMAFYLFKPWDISTFDIKFWILCGSLPYTLYMFIYELKSNKSLNLSEGLVNNKNKIFMIDSYCKILFPFLFGLFIYELIITLQNNFQIFNGQDTLHYLVTSYICVLLPIFMAIDLKIIPRRRNPAPLKDLTLILFISAIHCAYVIVMSIVFKLTFVLIAPTIGNSIVLTSVTFLGYVLYDYINHKMTGGEYYMIFNSMDKANIENISGIPSNI